MDIYERYGRKQEELENIKDTFKMTLELLVALKDGEAVLEKLVVSEKGWSYGETPKSD